MVFTVTGSPADSRGVRPTIYFARAVDDLDREAVLAAGREVAEVLAARGMQMIDPVARWDDSKARTSGGSVADLVQSDLGFLRRSDALLVDMTIADRDYIGCVCELTYAHGWRIPAVVWVGDSGREQRMWLRYHATAVVRTRAEALDALASMVG